MTADILILSNGPGEVTTWVRPVVKQLRQQLGNDRNQIRISVILSPCSNSSGKEADIARSYPEVDRVQASEHFWHFLLWGKTCENWEWRDRGVIIFLGGDQFFPVVIGKRLGYRTVVYAEWEARWHNWIDRFGVMKPEVAFGVSHKYAHKFTVVGDLMADVATDDVTEITDELSVSSTDNPELIGILPGSKAAKLMQGVPLTLAIAEYIHAKRPQTKFVIPVAPTLDVETLVSFADPQQNSFVQTFGFSGASPSLQTTTPLACLWGDKERTNRETQRQLLFGTETLREQQGEPQRQLPATGNPSLSMALQRIGLPTQSLDHTPHPILKTAKGLCVDLWTKTPAYDILSQCSLCLTTVGANTAELGSLAVPMIVLLPTQQLDAMRSWDGLPGLLANLPLVGSGFAKIINSLVLRRFGLLAWPNIWAQEMVVPELVGKLQPQEVGELVLDFLSHPEKLDDMRAKLRSIRGEAGAAHKLANLVCEELKKL